jgi:S-formylglutathione hydrolase FrmB
MNFNRLMLLLLLLPACRHLPPSGTKVPDQSEEPLVFRVSFPSSIRANPASGRLLLFLTKAQVEPREHIDWMDLDPVFAVDVTNLPPNTVFELTPKMFRAPDALAYPTALGRIPPGKYSAQALLDLDNTARSWNTGPGNLYSAATHCELKGSRGGIHELPLTNVIPAPEPMATNEWIRLFEIRSDSLSAFHQRDIYLRAGVLLPKGYAESGKRYPVVYQIPGFGGRHVGVHGFLQAADGQRWQKGEFPYEALLVVLDPDVPFGHSVFANSDNNGPVGDALVREFIPALESAFRVIPEPRARVVTGHSSGGWASLWLQVAYPDFFGACWSSAPDPVDFRFFQTLNIYSDRNGHWTPTGQPRGLARDQHKIIQTFAPFNHWEYVTGPGGQLDSFNAVFSRRRADGRPEQLMDKLSGEINPAAAESWKRYDIRLILEENWAILGPKLKGKIHVLCGGWDTFYLENGVRALKDFLDKTDFGGYVEFVPGNHGSMWTQALKERTRREIATFLSQ